MTEQEKQFELMKSQEKVNELRQEVASMNKECEFWQQARIQASIAAMQGMLSSKETMESITKQARNHNISVQTALATLAVVDADALIAELQKKGGQDDNNH